MFKKGTALTILLTIATSAAGQITIETVHVGNPGNAGEWSGESYGGYKPDRVCGAVDYEYSVGKYEVTAGQYCTFLNAAAGVDTYGLYNTSMWSDSGGCKIERYAGNGTLGAPYQYRVAADRADRPVNYVSWGDAARFVNWLTNGQPTGAQGAGTTETGSYALNGVTAYTDLLTVTRIVDADRVPGQSYYFIPTEDEWYKAAYYNPATGSYYNYPTSSNSAPSNVLANPDPGNHANFWNWVSNVYTIGSPYFRTEVGEFECSDSPYGTFDQGGNVWEWNESILLGTDRGARGGSYTNGATQMNAAYRHSIYPSYENYGFGFRIVEVPEPTSIAIVALGCLGILNWRRGLKR